jgi:hypothetical protein
MAERLAELFDGNGTLSLRVLDGVTVAEELLADAKRRHPDRALELDALFLALRWPPLLRASAPLVLYRVHAQEIIDRLLAGGDLAEPTEVEMLAVVVLACAIVPVSHDVVLALQASRYLTPIWREVLDDAVGRHAVDMPDALRNQLLTPVAEVVREQNKSRGFDIRALYDESLERRRRRAEMEVE